MHKSKRDEILKEQGFLLQREFVVYDDSTSESCVAICSRQQPSTMQQFVAHRSTYYTLRFKGFADDFNTVHEFLESQQCFVGVDPALVGRWVPSQRNLQRMYPELGERVLPPGRTSGNATALLRTNPSLTFVLSERVSDRKTLSVVSFRAQQLIKTLIVREPQGYVMVPHRRRATLMELLQAVFGVISTTVPPSTLHSPVYLLGPILPMSAAATPNTGSATMAIGVIAGDSELATQRDSGRRRRSNIESSPTMMLRAPRARWMVQPTFESMKDALVVATQSSNDDDEQKRLLSTSSEDAAAKTWHCYVRRTKLYDLDPIHRDLDGKSLSEQPWYHFAISSSEAACLLDLYGFIFFS